MNRDRNMSWNRKLKFYPWQLGDFINDATTDVMKWAYAPNTKTAEITGLDIAAPLIAAAGALDTGDGWSWNLEIPYDLDIGKNVGLGVAWTHDATGSTNLASLTWTATYNVVNLGANIYNSAGGSGATFKLAEPVTALNTTITAQTNFTFANAFEFCVSPRGIINANILLATSGFWSIRVRASAATASFDTKVWLLGLILDYNVHKTVGTGSAAPTGVLQNWLDLSPAPATTGP